MDDYYNNKNISAKQLSVDPNDDEMIQSISKEVARLDEACMKKYITKIRRRLETGEDNRVSNSTEQPESSISTQETTIPDVRETNTSFLQQSVQPLNIKAVTSLLNTENSYRAAVEKNQEIARKNLDKSRIEQIQYYLSCSQPLPITDNVSVNVELPIDVLPDRWPAFIKSFSCSLNVPETTLIPGLLAAVFTALCGKYKIEVRKDYFEPCTEFIIAVMPSGSRKSAIVKTLKIPLDKFIEKRQAEFDKKAPNKKILIKLYKNAEKNLLKTFADQLEGKDGAEIDRILQYIEKELEPLKKKLSEFTSRPSLLMDSPTMKKFAENMKTQNEFMAILDAEGAIWKHRVTANEDTILLKSYTMEYFGNETATNGSVVMQNPCVVICSYIQPEVAFKLYSNEQLKDDGLLPRILPLFSLSKPAIQNIISQDINPDLMAMYENKISSILEYSWESRYE